ncbi:hypothetical protein DBV15_11101, partial [Temnothorax longispinosus]
MEYVADQKEEYDRILSKWHTIYAVAVFGNSYSEKSRNKTSLAGNQVAVKVILFHYFLAMTLRHRNLTITWKTAHCRNDFSKAEHAIGAIINQDVRKESTEVILLDSYARCGLCKRKQDKKTKYMCPSCNRPMCQKHRTGLCVDCAVQD